MRQLTEREQWLLYGIAIGVWMMFLARLYDWRFNRRATIHRDGQTEAG